MNLDRIHLFDKPLLHATHMRTEAISQSIARRILTQSIPAQVIRDADVREHVARLAPHLAGQASGVEVDGAAMEEALRAQQGDLAADVRSLFRNQPHMEHVCTQIEAKAGKNARTERQHASQRG